MIYIASPYTHRHKRVMHQRYLQVQEYVGQLYYDYITDPIYDGVIPTIYSPIVHNHMIAKRFNLPVSFDFWKEYNYSMLRLAESLCVLKLEGWKTSKGLKDEIEYAEYLRLPIEFVDYKESQYFTTGK